MECFDCRNSGARTEAVGFCHHCGAAICPTHTTVASIPIEIQAPIAKSVELPKRARMLLCPVCVEALAQNHASWFGERASDRAYQAFEQQPDHALLA